MSIETNNRLASTIIHGVKNLLSPEQVTYNAICTLIASMEDDSEQFKKNWKAIVYHDGQGQKWIGWKCIPMGIELRLLHSATQRDVLSHPDTPYTYYCIDSFHREAKKNNMLLLPYKGDMYQQCIDFLPGDTNNIKSWYLGMMFSHMLSGECIGTGSYSKKYEQWDEYDNHFSFFMTHQESHKANNVTTVSGNITLEGISKIRGEKYPFAYFSNNCDDQCYMPVIVYQK